MPTVEMKLPARKAASLKRTSRQVFPTPESPTSITCVGEMGGPEKNNYNWGGSSEDINKRLSTITLKNKQKVWTLMSSTLWDWTSLGV